MGAIFGLLFTFGMVFGGYALGGGGFDVILHALPIEGMMIGGAAIGSFVMGNKAIVIKAACSDAGLCFKSTKWGKDDYKDILCLMFLVTKTIKKDGILAVEAHIENPSESSIFSQYPKILHDHFALDFICDTLRMITMSLEDPYQVEDHMQRLLDKHHHEVLSGAHAIQGMADALPAIGIVAAVLGVIKTMSSINEPPEVLGALIGGALVGTFMGVFMAYCMVAPLATKATSMHEQDGHFYHIIRDIMVAHLKGNNPQVSVEIGRANVPTTYQPTFFELEEAMNETTA